MLRKKKTFKSIISLVLVTLLMISCFPITVGASTKVTDITIEPVTMIEYTNGYFDSDYNEATEEWDLEYYRYWPEDVMEYTITLADGTEISEYGNGFEYDGDWCYLDVETDQSYENAWTAGNTYKMTASFGGVSTEVDVTIVESPVESIEVNPIDVIEKLDGHIESEYNYETDQYDLDYFYYDIEYYLKYIVRFKDGSVESGIGDYVLYNNEEYYFEVVTDQSYDNQWTVGNTYTAEVSLMGVSTEVDVTVTESPVKNVTVEPITVYQYIDSYLEAVYDWDTDEYIGEYDCYTYDEKLNFTVEWADGTKSSYSYYDGIEYNGSYGYVQTYDDQSYDTPWETGNTYTATLDVMGCETEFSVTVEESPVTSLELVKAPYDTSYVLGEVINPNGAVMRVNYKDGTSEEITLDNLMLCDVNSVYLEKFDTEVALSFYGDIAYDGYNSFTIYFLGKELEVDIDIANTYPSEIEISGKGVDLNIEITLDNRNKVTAKAISFEPWYGEEFEGYEFVRGAVYTDIGVFVIDIYENIDTGDFSIDMVIFSEYDETLISANTLKARDNQWLALQEKMANMSVAIVTQADYVDSYNGEVTEENIDELLSVAIMGAEVYIDENSILDYNADGMIVQADFMRRAFEDVFGITPDLTLSSNYDKSNDTVLVKLEGFIEFDWKHPMNVEQTKDGIVVTSVGYEVWGVKSLTITFDENLKVAGFEITRDVDFMAGDVNGDGVLSIIDATEIQKYLAGLVDFTDSEMAVADYNGDGVVSIIDATDIQKVLAGLI